MINVEELKGWLPVDAVVSNGRPGLLWMNMRGVEFREPFFHQTVLKLRAQQPSPEERFTEFDALLRFEKMTDSLGPDGFVFHSSRCGSTLITNALRCLEDAIVLSEPDPVDKLLGRFITDAENSAKELLYTILLRALINALGQKRSSRERRLFIKFSCCSLEHHNRLQRIWPDVPRLFVYRAPVETIVSNLQTVPQWLLDEDHRVLAAIIGVTEMAASTMRREELCARALGKFYSIGSELANDSTMLLNYDQLSVETILQVIDFFKVTPGSREIEAITNVGRTYSKDVNGKRPFVDDRDIKQMKAPLLVRDMASRWAASSYQSLETKREQLRSEQLRATSCDRKT